ncbi:MAG: GTP-binding protein [Oscillochloris sp.]|nr:GTP-binding protein [Oscillochloris sp.]
MNRLTQKICLLGDFSVGKTSLVRQFVEGRFDDRYLSTIGVRVSRRQAVVNAHELSLLIWDIAGSEAFSQVVHNYYAGSGGALLVCDLTRLDTLGTLERYSAEFRQINPAAHLVLLANKLDRSSERAIEHQQLADFAARLNIPWYLTSAKTGAGVEASFLDLSAAIITQRSM